MAVVNPTFIEAISALVKNTVPGLVNIQKAIEDGHRNNGFTN